MRKSRFKDEQIVAMLRETDRDAVPVVVFGEMSKRNEGAGGNI